jgi:hypothetical protein
MLGIDPKDILYVKNGVSVVNKGVVRGDITFVKHGFYLIKGNRAWDIQDGKIHPPAWCLKFLPGDLQVPDNTLAFPIAKGSKKDRFGEVVEFVEPSDPEGKLYIKMIGIPKSIENHYYLNDAYAMSDGKDIYWIKFMWGMIMGGPLDVGNAQRQDACDVANVVFEHMIESGLL